MASPPVDQHDRGMTNAPFPPPNAPWPAPCPRQVPRPPESCRPEVPSRWQPPQLSPAGWLATIGAVLLLAASIIVVAGNWQSIDPEVRFAGLVASLVAVYGAAEAGRRRLPSTSQALATLAASLTAPVGVAAAATLHQPWPVCTLVGGATALAATEVQSRRWEVPALKALTVVAFGLAAVGASALTSIPVTVIAALGAAVALAAGATRRAVALALAVGVAPLLTSLADLGIGTGTLPRIGADGTGLTWSALVSCTISAIVIGVVAHRHDNAPLALGAIATFGAGLLTALASGGADAQVWWTVPAIALIALEAVAATNTASVWRVIARRAAPFLAIGLGAVAFVLPYHALVQQSDWAVATDARSLVPFALTALALVAAGSGSARRTGDARWSATALTAASAAAFAMLVTSELPLWTASIWPFVVWVGLRVATPRSILDLPTAACASWVVAATLFDDRLSTNVRIALVVAAGLGMVMSTATTERTDHGFRLILTACVSGGAVALISTDTIGAWAILTVALIAMGVTLRPAPSTWPLAVAGAITYGTVGDQVGAWPSVAIVVALALAFVGLDPRLAIGAPASGRGTRRHRRRLDPCRVGHGSRHRRSGRLGRRDRPHGGRARRSPVLRCAGRRNRCVGSGGPCEYVGVTRLRVDCGHRPRSAARRHRIDPARPRRRAPRHGHRHARSDQLLVDDRHQRLGHRPDRTLRCDRRRSGGRSRRSAPARRGFGRPPSPRDLELVGRRSWSRARHDVAARFADRARRRLGDTERSRHRDHRPRPSVADDGWGLRWWPAPSWSSARC